MVLEKDMREAYNIIKPLGRGTFGDVYQAEPTDAIGQVVAVKVLRTTTASVCDRLREVIFYRRMPAHPKLVALHDLFVDIPTGHVVLALEHMSGTLLQLMDLTRHQDRTFSALVVAGMVKDMLHGIAHIHAHGFVHRDIKPENVLVGGHDRHIKLKLCDFGLSRPLSQPGPWTGYVATRWYRAPEQVLDLGAYGAGVDVWAVCVILVELCNLRPLFPGRATGDMVIKLHVALGTPSRHAWGGPSPDVAAALAELYGEEPEGNGLFDGNGLLESSAWFRFERHDVFLDVLRAGTQWDSARRPTASRMLAAVRELIEVLGRSRASATSIAAGFGIPSK